MESALTILYPAAGALGGLVLLMVIFYWQDVSLSPIAGHSLPLQSINRFQLRVLLLLIPISTAFLPVRSWDLAFSVFSVALALFVLLDSSVLQHFLDIRDTGREARDTAVEMSQKFSDTQTNLDEIRDNVIELSAKSNELVDRVSELASYKGIGSLDDICEQMAGLVEPDLGQDERLTLVASSPLIGRVSARRESFDLWFHALQKSIRKSKDQLRVITYNPHVYTIHEKLGNRLSIEEQEKIRTEVKVIFNEFDDFGTKVDLDQKGPDSIPYLHFLVRHNKKPAGNKVAGRAIVWQLKPVSDTPETTGTEGESPLIEGSGFLVKDNIFIEVLLAIYDERAGQLGSPKLETSNG